MNAKILENRFVDFSVGVIQKMYPLRKIYIIKHLIDQVLKSSSSCSLNYGEAQSAESSRDFRHKLQIVAKELRETYNSLKIIERSLIELSFKDPQLQHIINENNELISIIVSSLKTLDKNQKFNNS